MGDNMFGEGTIPVHIAIHREMEYRRKLARMQQIPEAEFCKNLRPFVVEPPMQGTSLGSHQRPSSNATPPLPKLKGPNHGLKSSHPSNSASSLRPCPSRSSDLVLEIPLRQQQGPNKVQAPMQGPSLGSHQRLSSNATPSSPKLHGPNHGLKSSHPSISASSLCPCANRSSDMNLVLANPSRQQQGPTNQFETSQPAVGLGDVQNHNDYTFCKICQVPCAGYANFMQHMEGRKHKNKQLEKNAGKIPDSVTGESPRRWCGMCKIWCMNEELFQVHLGGKPHMLKLAVDNRSKQIVVHGELGKVSNGGGGSTGNQQGPRRCDLCDIWCTDRVSLELHRKGKRHIAQLHESQNKKARF